MSIIKINAITVDPDSGDELAHRFAARAGAVDGQDGFEGFELLKPTDDRNTWLVVTRWRDEESFAAWLSSPAFGRGHGQSKEHGRAADSTEQPAQRPVGVQSELWSYVVAGGSTG
jgi:heme-degrading monooxygenase HmoA